MKKFLAMVLALMMVLSLSAAAFADGAEDISLKVWIPEEEMELTQELCAEFDEAHPEWNITFDIAVWASTSPSTTWRPTRSWPPT